MLFNGSPVKENTGWAIKNVRIPAKKPKQGCMIMLMQIKAILCCDIFMG
jgi:hypothetical protein